ncbi:helix-turn-helix domain-containing protein [Rufibacter aurantiacus]|uniref:helix-turn-helix domain-containing protein n=1 Tax=Rufibacter aurantiacus TaxID=2817374 RepID=UPI001B30231B|nr:helix-turn-helix transcriptional regulator [Rufibacter aurantiacus]
MSELLPRITEILSWSSLGPAAFADEIGLARPVLSHILSSRNKASLEVVQKILTRFPEISPSWLLLGQGEMLSKLGETKKSHAPGTSLSETPANLKPQEALPAGLSKVQTGNLEGKAPEKSKTGIQRQLTKVLLFYSDGTFESFDPK